jgi:hypothetical protein
MAVPSGEIVEAATSPRPSGLRADPILGNVPARHQACCECAPVQWSPLRGRLAPAEGGGTNTLNALSTKGCRYPVVKRKHIGVVVVALYVPPGLHVAGTWASATSLT